MFDPRGTSATTGGSFCGESSLDRADSKLDVTQFSMQEVLALIRKQFLEIRATPQLRALTLIVPLFQLVLFGYAASLDVREVTLAVADFDRSDASRSLVSRFTSSGYFTVVRWLDTYDDVDMVLMRGEAKMALIIPPSFGNMTLEGAPAPIQALIDGSDGYMANIASNYASAIVAKHSQEVLLHMSDRTGKPLPAIGAVDTETRVWYNPELKSRRFFIPSIIGLMLMFTTIIASSTSIVREREEGTLEQLIVAPIRPWHIVVGKLAPFVITSTLTTINFLILAWLVFDITVRGSVLLFLGFTVLFNITTLGLGLFVSTISRTQQQAGFTTTFFVLPPFLYLSGFSFPIENMPAWIQPLTYLVPLRYYLAILRGVFLQGVGVAELWPNVVAILGFGVVIVGASFMRFRKGLA